ncbi:MAG: hypothetical protein H6536_02660 [Bacteroidales bacterium]|nr:hypothetical protein [Bacteroidales bacterium]
MKKAAIFSSFYTNTIHPRIESEQNILVEEGYLVDLYNDNNPPTFFWKLINVITFNIFKWHTIFFYKKIIKHYNIIIVYDLQLLPLVIYGKIKKQKIIYETLDFNLDINFYHIKKRIPLIKPFAGLFKSALCFSEKFIARRFTTKILVNSFELQKYFGKKQCEVNLYTSPFEGVIINPESNKPMALLYMGLFTQDKGAFETIEVSKMYGLPLFVFGTVREKTVIDEINKNKNIFYIDRIAPIELKKRIEDLSFKYNFIGTSLIQPIHYSYAVQEANKDIDYMALGIPFIGNERKPTLQKIMSNCGVLFNDNENVLNLLSNFDFYRQVSLNALNYYHKHYNYKLFKSTFITTINDKY